MSIHIIGFLFGVVIVFHILQMQVPYQVYDFQKCSPILWVVYSHSDGAFSTQQLLFLMMFSLSIFALITHLCFGITVYYLV